ncbi:MAG: SDR family oxidoreductase [Saprospiraceae bacterium]|nr:SDR family oxidoreductase [Saprospiraceae bacterium]MBP7699434.1 SDR family oxidoreductase [Saprospiraceae bacterium]
MKLVITGATKGIGRAIVLLFAEKGFDVALCARTGEDVQKLISFLQDKYPKQHFIGHAVDMRQKNDVISFAEKIKKQWDFVDVLINNVGVFTPGMIHKEEDGILEQLIETNLYSAYYLTRALLPTMLSRESGHIFNMCSIASIVAYPNGGSYSISKFAMLGFSKVLREELKNKGIKVTAILPGATWSDSWADVSLPAPRLMDATDIAAVIYGAYTLGASAVVEELIIRPQLGDL